MASLKRLVTSAGVTQYEVRWRDPRTGKQPRRRYPTKALAQRALQHAMSIERLDPLAPLDRNGTVAMLIGAEEASSNRRDPKTRRYYINRHVPQWLLNKRVRAVSIEDIESVLADAATSLSEASVTKLKNYSMIACARYVWGRSASTSVDEGQRSKGAARQAS